MIVHGGPGLPSNYLEPFTFLDKLYGIPVILYDQLGCGRSLPDGVERDKLNDTVAKSDDRGVPFWTIDLFVRELDNLIRHLGIEKDFDLFGHSWGGMVAASYVTTYQPPGLKSLVLGNTVASMDDRVEGSRKLITDEDCGFPRELCKVMKFVEGHEDAREWVDEDEWGKFEGAGLDLDSGRYGEAMKIFMDMFVIGEPYPVCWMNAVKSASVSPAAAAM